MIKVCNYCKEEYSAIRNNQKFCSSYCRLMYFREKKVRYKLSFTERHCLYCNSLYIPIRIENKQYYDNMTFLDFFAPISNRFIRKKLRLA